MIEPPRAAESCGNGDFDHRQVGFRQQSFREQQTMSLCQFNGTDSELSANRSPQMTGTDSQLGGKFVDSVFLIERAGFDPTQSRPGEA